MVEYYEQISDPEVINTLGELLEKVAVTSETEGDIEIDEDVKKLVDEIIDRLESVERAPECPHLKGILKPSRCRCGSSHHVDFTMRPELIRSYDEETDYTIDIQFVEQHPVKVVSYRKLFAEKKDAKTEETDR